MLHKLILGSTFTELGNDITLLVPIPEILNLEPPTPISQAPHPSELCLPSCRMIHPILAAQDLKHEP